MSLLLGMTAMPAVSVAGTAGSRDASGTVVPVSPEVVQPIASTIPPARDGQAAPSVAEASARKGQAEAPSAEGDAITPASNLFGDAYEPDDTMATAKAIPADGLAQSRSFHVVTDDDWVSLDVIAGVTYYIETREGSLDIDTLMRLYDADLVQLAVSDDDSDAYEFCSYIQYTATADETLYLLITSDGRADVGSYLLVVNSGGPDAYEPDGTAAQARPIVVGAASQAHTYHVVDDEDWVSFEAVAGVTYLIETLPGTRLDTYLYLYDADLNLLASDDDGGPGAFSIIDYTATASGTLFVSSNSFAYASTGAYRLQVTAAETGDWYVRDGYEPDDTAAAARPISSDGAAQAHTFHLPDDEDWVRFDAVAGVTYYLETLEGTLEIDTLLYLYSSDFTELDFDDDGSERYRYCSYLEYTPTTDQTLYVRVHSYRHDGVGSYRLRVGATLPDMYEVDDTAAAAGPIAVDGAPQSRTFHVPGDSDWAYFDAIAGLDYAISTWPGSDLDTELHLYDADLNEIAYDDDSGVRYFSHIEYTPAGTGRIYVRVIPAAPGSIGTYELTVDCSDMLPPVSTSDVVASYTSSARITITASDPAPGVGVDATYYTLDGGAKQTYTGPIVVATTGSHVLNYWSIDRATNDEAPKSASFTVAAPASPAPSRTGARTNSTTVAAASTAAAAATASVEPVPVLESAEVESAEDDADGEDEDAREETGEAEDPAEEQGSLLWWILGGIAGLGLIGLLAALARRGKK